MPKVNVINFVTIAILALIVGAVSLPLIQRERGTINYSPRCPYVLFQVSLALHNYHDVHNSFPPVVLYDEEGTPIHSWRALLLPHLETGDAYTRYNFDEPWDSPGNLKVGESVASFFACCYCQEGSPKTHTTILAITGEGTAWPSDKVISLTDVKDGADQTIFLVSVPHSGIQTLEPRDYIAGDPMAQGAHGNGHPFSLVNGAVRFLSHDVDLIPHSTIDAGDFADTEQFQKVPR